MIPEELSEESLEKALMAIRDMLSDIEKPTGKPTKVIIQPALLAQRGYTIEDVSKMIRENT
jgi:SOS response regulatory protein OraA/RecX